MWSMKRGFCAVFLVILCTVSIQCDVSHVVLGGESPILDSGTIEVLHRNITDYLIELAHGGSPQMQLKQIYSASKQIVTGTLYTVDALLQTPDGAKKCQIRVLEKPWLDFCKVSVTCENGGVYEVTFNPNQVSHHQLPSIDILPPSIAPKPVSHLYQQPTVKPPVSVLQNSLFNSFQSKFQPQAPAYTPVYTPAKPITPVFTPKAPVYAPVYTPKAPAFVPAKPITPVFTPKAPVYAPVYTPKAPAFVPSKPITPVFIPKAPVYTPVYTTKTPVYTPLFTTKAPIYTPIKPITPIYTPPKPQPPVYTPIAPVYTPQVFTTQPTTLPPLPIDIRQNFDFPIPQIHKGDGVPKPIFPPKPELNVLVEPYDVLPQGPAFDTYIKSLFHDFMIKYERKYIDEPHEMAHRLNVFTDNFRTLQEHSKADTLACQYSVTELSDLTKGEFERILGFDTSLFSASDVETIESPSNQTQGRSFGGGLGDGVGDGVGDGDVPEKYDQRDDKIVTRVKFQGDCGACWAFVTTAVIEGLCAKRTKKLQEFSEQSLIDCDNSNFECKGGIPPKALKHIAKRGGLELESVYPYVFGKSGSCRFDPKTVRVKVSGAVGFKKNDEEAMKRWLFKNGPILVGINADPLQYYKCGILNPTPQLCSPKKINHGVTLIGYGVDVNTSTGERLPYWIVKNQWGTRWGENGFFRIARGKNACGLALWAYSAKLANVENNCLLQGA